MHCTSCLHSSFLSGILRIALLTIKSTGSKVFIFYIQQRVEVWVYLQQSPHHYQVLANRYAKPEHNKAGKRKIHLLTYVATWVERPVMFYLRWFSRTWMLSDNSIVGSLQLRVLIEDIKIICSRKGKCRDGCENVFLPHLVSPCQINDFPVTKLNKWGMHLGKIRSRDDIASHVSDVMLGNNFFSFKQRAR